MNNKNNFSQNRVDSRVDDSQGTQQSSQQKDVERDAWFVYSEQQNPDVLSTNEALSRRKRNQQQRCYVFHPKQAVNTYISNQVRGKSIDQTQSLEIDSIIDVCL